MTYCGKRYQPDPMGCCERQQGHEDECGPHRLKEILDAFDTLGIKFKRASTSAKSSSTP
jgi:hypothetical protein